MSKLDETGTIIDKEITKTGRNKNDLGQILQWVYYDSRALTTQLSGQNLYALGFWTI